MAFYYNFFSVIFPLVIKDAVISLQTLPQERCLFRCCPTKPKLRDGYTGNPICILFTTSTFTLLNQEQLALFRQTAWPRGLKQRFMLAMIVIAMIVIAA